jgi:hypothetical protein
MSDSSYEDFVINMNHKARSGAYDNKHSIADLRERAKRGDRNAQGALRMRTGEEIDVPAKKDS